MSDTIRARSLNHVATAAATTNFTAVKKTPE